MINDLPKRHRQSQQKIWRDLVLHQSVQKHNGVRPVLHREVEHQEENLHRHRKRSTWHVKPVHTLSKQIRTNAPFTSVTVSAANEKRIRTFNKNADRSGQRATVCEPLTSKKAACAYMYLGNNAIDVLTFNIAPRGKGYIIGTVSSDRYTPEELGLSGQSDVTELLGELTK